MTEKPVGNATVMATLEQLARQSRLDNACAFHHAWIFTGPPGVGKYPTALWWAAGLKCRGAVDDATQIACGNCQSCRAFALATHRDLHLVEPTRAKGNSRGPLTVRIESTRELIPKMAMRPLHEGPNIAIIRDVHTASIDAQNCLLKLLEEPPGSAVLILIADDTTSLESTIRSRCRLLRFGAVDDATIHAKLLAAGRSEQEATAATAAARGSLGQAIKLDEAAIQANQDLLLAFESLSAPENSTAAKVFEDLGGPKSDRKKAVTALKHVLIWQELKIRAHFGLPALAPGPELTRFLEASRDASADRLVADASKILQTLNALSRNANIKLAIGDLILDMKR